MKKDRGPGPGPAAFANPGPIARGQGLAVNGRRDKGYPGMEDDGLTVMEQGQGLAQGLAQGQGLEGSMENINNVNEAVVSGTYMGHLIQHLMFILCSHSLFLMII